MLNTELGELQAQLSELQAARDDAARKRAESQAKRQQERTVAHRWVEDRLAVIISCIISAVIYHNDCLLVVKL